MFSDKLSSLLEVLNVSGTVLAQYAGLDRSGISRLKNGVRTPKPESPTMQKLINGLYSYAVQNHSLDRLLTAVNAEGKTDEAGIKNAIFLWLCRDTLSTDHYESSFADRLNTLMILAGISNVSLGHMLNVDASLISRYRSGERSPKSNPVLAGQLSNTLLFKIRKGERLAELSGIMHIPVENIDEQSLYEWLNNYPQMQDNSVALASSILSSFDAHAVSCPDPELFAYTLPAQDEKKIYIGPEEFRLAVLRFLNSAANSDRRELLLYSDEKMDWMVNDREFLKKWGMLMSVCLKKGIKIRIIHNIDRDISEMNSALTSWIPLYMSGGIEAYYCMRPGNQRFSHTLFLCPGLSCIHACHAEGKNMKGIYFYESDPQLLQLLGDEYQYLLNASSSLLHITPCSEKELHAEGIRIEGRKSCFTLAETPFNHIKLLINKDSATVIKTTEPCLSFHLKHPLMHNAFLAYIQRYVEKHCSDPQIREALNDTINTL